MKNKEHGFKRLKRNYHSRLCNIFRKRNHNKNVKAVDALGCEWEQLKEHLESKFDADMTWDNYGKWHIDHIIPLGSARTAKDIIRLSHYTNLQPLWAKENLAKSDLLQLHNTKSGEYTYIYKKNLVYLTDLIKIKGVVLPRNLKHLSQVMKSHNLARIANETGVPYITVIRIANGQTDPRFSNVLKLVNWLLEQEADQCKTD